MYASRVKPQKMSRQEIIQKTKKRNKSVAKKLKKQKLGFVATVSFVVIIALLLAKSWENWNKIQNKNEQITGLEREYNQKRINNEALQQQVDAPIDDEYIADVARGQGYRGSDEILFYLEDGE